MTESITKFPLSWPAGWTRAPVRVSLQGSRFNDWEKTLKRLNAALEYLGATDVILSTNMPLRRDGSPTAARGLIEDPGVAVYFKLDGKPMAMAQDNHFDLVDNIRSLAIAVEAMNTLHRHGGGQMMQRAFLGFQALPAPQVRLSQPWWETLKINADATPDAIRDAARYLKKQYHPDVGGPRADPAMLQQVMEAEKIGLAERS